MPITASKSEKNTGRKPRRLPTCHPCPTLQSCAATIMRSQPCSNGRNPRRAGARFRAPGARPQRMLSTTQSEDTSDKAVCLLTLVKIWLSGGTRRRLQGGVDVVVGFDQWLAVPAWRRARRAQRHHATSRPAPRMKHTAGNRAVPDDSDSGVSTTPGTSDIWYT